MDPRQERQLRELSIDQEAECGNNTSSNASSNASSSESSKNALFCQELKKTGFKIFQPISDHGFIAWKPSGPYKDLSQLTTISEITDFIQLDAVPSPLVDVTKLSLPQTFRNLAPQEQKNSYPYGQNHIGGLHVVSKHHGIDMNDIDFAFGGSVLEMLARQGVSSDEDALYLATLVPGMDNSNTILVAKSKDFVQDFADNWFQFRRMVTGSGDAPDGPYSVDSMEHLHLMQVGTYRVFFQAEIDASYKGESVKVKVKNPRYWGTSVMFQMISNGSPYLCSGKKTRVHGGDGSSELVGVDLRRLSDVAHDAISGEQSLTSMERNILSGMAAIKKQMEHAKAGRVFKIIFSWRGGHLQLSPTATTKNSTILLPKVDLVKKLVGSSTCCGQVTAGSPTKEKADSPH